MTTGINQAQALALAQLLNQIRPDWPAPSLIAHLRSHGDHPAEFADIVVAAVTLATEDRIKTPALIWEAGPHWPERAKATLPRIPCPLHPEEDNGTCRCCAADRLAANTTNAGQSTVVPPATCQDHPNQPAGTCPTCWSEVRNSTRRRNHIGRHNPGTHP